MKTLLNRTEGRASRHASAKCIAYLSISRTRDNAATGHTEYLP